MAQQLRQDPSAGSDMLDLFNNVVGYYCSLCGDFYGPDELGTASYYANSN